jgi:hypothetical protein
MAVDRPLGRGRVVGAHDAGPSVGPAAEREMTDVSSQAHAHDLLH